MELNEQREGLNCFCLRFSVQVGAQSLVLSSLWLSAEITQYVYGRQWKSYCISHQSALFDIQDCQLLLRRHWLSEIEKDVVSESEKEQGPVGIAAHY